MSCRGSLSALMLAVFVLSGCNGESDQVTSNASSQSFEGQWLVVNYWAEWCGPCRTEVPELNALDVRLSGTGARVVGINYDGLEGDALQRSASVLGITFPLMEEKRAAVYKLPRPKALPTTYVVDSGGVLRQELVGEQTEEGLATVLHRLRTGE
ncbi:TlpA disulfide reductase family protein [Pseudomonas matsuisoli]|uniref:Thioredoxin n=1 Tax=Pseudomonas matsuisoli TaxID=1515666 RepID=A0A917US68_9PSED|nr:TlpA disulfide reductase family protein [Pseudomonas matsuisoli]GGJ81083.1 thioredoxin [Pseudomonas matsuisoli]